MKMPSASIGCVVFLGILVLSCIGILLYLSWPEPAPKRPFSSNALLLELEDLGPAWKLRDEYHISGKVRYHVEDWGYEFVLQDAQGREVLSIKEFVNRHADLRDAHLTFGDYEIYFKNYSAPPELSAIFQPQYAEEWMLFCTEGECGYFAVYEEFYVSFVVEEEISKAISLYTSYSQIASWLRTLDERAGKLLGKTK